MIPLLMSLLDAAVVLSLGLLASAVLRQRSAALRHAILAASIVTASVMPALKYVLPQIPLIAWGESARVIADRVAFSSGGALSQSAMRSVAVASGGFPWTMALLIWMAGAIAIGAGVITAFVRLSRLRARCIPVEGRWRDLADALARECGIRRVLLLQSDDPTLLVTCGVLKPCIILPAGAAVWPDDLCRSVLRHELAHITRRDAAMQAAGEVLRVLQWINPLAWIACRRLRHESEYACDDAVLIGGVEPTAYATHLLDVARHVSGRRWVSAPAIAEPSTLERRIIAMLREQRNRTPLGRRGWFVTASAALVIGVPLAAAGLAPATPARTGAPASASDVMLPAGNVGRSVVPSPESPRVPASPAASPRTHVLFRSQSTSSIAGSVFDQLGGTLPAVTVTLSDPRGGPQLTVQTDPYGRFAFRALQSGEYELRASLPGFTAFINTVTVGPGAAEERTITLPIGTLQEHVTVSCSAASPLARLRTFAGALGDDIVPVLSAHEADAQMLVGGNVRAPIKLKDVHPVCPSNLPEAETVVHLVGHIGIDGRINDAALAQPQAGEAPATGAVNAALDAVRQWMFRPTVLDDQPIEAIMMVTVVFTR
jgi:beta-lactamase regulating signal transducer with metallopeptidase domain